MIKAVPITRQDARAFIDAKHRHHVSAKADKYRIGAEIDGELVGVAQIGRPVSRALDDGKTLEVLRLCTDGSKNVCSFLYSRAARIAQAMGYERIVTYILESESGASLLAAGWHLEANGVGGGTWDTPSRPRALAEDGRQKYPTEKKQRWGKQL